MHPSPGASKARSALGPGGVCGGDPGLQARVWPGLQSALGPDSPQAAGHGGAGSEACRLPCLAEAGGQNDGFEVSLVQSSVIVSLLCTPPCL